MHCSRLALCTAWTEFAFNLHPNLTPAILTAFIAPRFVISWFSRGLGIPMILRAGSTGHSWIVFRLTLRVRELILHLQKPFNYIWPCHKDSKHKTVLYWTFKENNNNYNKKNPERLLEPSIVIAYCDNWCSIDCFRCLNFLFYLTLHLLSVTWCWAWFVGVFAHGCFITLMWGQIFRGTRGHFFFTGLVSGLSVGWYHFALQLQQLRLGSRGSFPPAWMKPL